MPSFNLYDFVRWLHLLALALGGGAAMVILVLAGLEDTREDLQGMTSLLWKRLVAWCFRAAVVLGLTLLVLRIQGGDRPFEAIYLHWKLVLVALLLLFSELAPRALARARRGAAMLALLLFMMASFVAINRDAFGYVRHAAPAGGGPYVGNVEPGE